MRTYLNLMRLVLETGHRKEDRTGTGTLSLFGQQMRFDLAAGFPVVTTKKLHLRSILHELLWFLRGDTNIAYLKENGVSIWDEWADENGELGPVYGKQWRSWPTPDGGAIDQMRDLVEAIRRNPDSRRLLVTAWNPAEVDSMALPPCHCLFQFYSRPATDLERERHLHNVMMTNPWSYPDKALKEALVPERVLDCQLYQRSADLFLGVPFNIASYALLTHMVAQVTDHIPGTFVHALGDVHLYLNHLDQARTQLERTPYALPRLHLNPTVTDLFSFSYEDIRLDGYQCAERIAAPVAV